MTTPAHVSGTFTASSTTKSHGGITPCSLSKNHSSESRAKHGPENQVAMRTSWAVSAESRSGKKNENKRGPPPPPSGHRLSPHVSIDDGPFVQRLDAGFDLALVAYHDDVEVVRVDILARH